ncbi:MAG: tetratricopeptide repeat protein [Bacteroidetes bacterium]|nr:tetratricopeptide repeat protein [Bacteroidota bacterium]
MNRFRTSIPIIIFACLYVTGISQERLTEREINIQKIFIEANREKILGNLENAVQLYEKVISQDRNNDAAAYELGRIYVAIGEEEKAIQAAKKAIDLNKENLWYKAFLADLYQKQNENIKAAEVYESMVKEYPSNELFYTKWAYYLVRANEIEKAIKVYDAFENNVGINEDVIRRKHSLYVGSGNNKKAAKELERLTIAYPNNIEYFHLLAAFYEQTKENQKAKEIYKEILQKNPEDSKASFALAGGNKKQGKNEVGYLISLKPVFLNPEISLNLKIKELIPFINEIAQSGNVSLAETVLGLTAILEEVHPSEAKPLAASGDVLYYSGRPMEALEKYKMTLEYDDTVYLVWEQLLYIYLESENYEDLLKVSEEAMEVFPNQADIYYLNGVANGKKEDFEEAAYMLNQARIMAGNDERLKFNIYSELGGAYFNLENFEEATKWMEKALELNNKDTAALELYGDILYKSGEEEKAMEQWMKSREKGNKSSLLDKKIEDKRFNE